MSVGVGSFISIGALLNHNSMVMESCHIDIGAVVKARAIVPSKTHIESSEVVSSKDDYSETDLNADWV